MRIVRAGLRAFVLPLVAPLATAHGPIAVREGFLLTLEDEEGRLGTGEATPLPAFGGEGLEACRLALMRALPELADGAERSLDAAIAAAAQACGARAIAQPVARAALEAALADLAAQREAVSLAQWIRRRAGLPGSPAARVRVQALVSGATPEAVASSGLRCRAQGFEVFKLKLAVDSRDRDVARDRERVAALRQAIGPRARIRLDANEAWSRSEAERALALLAPYSIEFVEQPVARDDLDGLAALDRGGPIPVAADEALLGAGLEACLVRRVAGIFVVKQAAIGGIGPTIALAARARQAGIRIVHSNLIEGRVGRETALALAAGLAESDDARSPRGAQSEEVHGLGTAALLARDLEDLPVEGSGTSGTHFDPGWLARFAEVHAARTALVHAGRSFRYAELAAAARAAGEALEEAGIGAGDLVAVLAPPTPTGVVLVHALLERRIVLLPINSRLTESEIANSLAATCPAALLVADSVDLDRARRLAEGEGCALLGFAAEPSGGRLDCAIARLAPGRREASSRPSRERAREDLRAIGAALVLQTSGTSGRPKAAVLSRANLIASAQASARLLGGGADDRWLLCMPLFHIGGLSILVRAALAGSCVVLESRFDAARVALALDAEAITHVSFVATTLEQVLAARDGRPAPESLRVVLVGGGPAPDALLARAIAAGFPIAPTYGLTEAASQVATRPPSARSAADIDSTVSSADSAASDLSTVPSTDLAAGLVPLPGVELRIVDASGLPVASGVEGEIEVRGPIVMAGYLDDPEATGRALRRGWLATGDVGRLDASGRLRVLDRRSDLIVSGGENVYPAELESVIAGHPDVVEAGVVGVPDARFGARPLAFVVWRAEAAADPAALARWCRERLAGYKLPVDFVAVDALPRGESGKLLRRALAGLDPRRAPRR